MSTYRLLLSSAIAEGIERVVVFGRPTLSRPITQLLSRDDIELVVVSGYADWIDPGRAASLVTDAVRLPEPGIEAGSERGGKRTRCMQAPRCPACGAALLHRTVVGGGALEPLGPDDVLFAGSSSPIRDLDLAPVGSASPLVYANRGLSGIDGSVSTAAGIALLWSARPMRW